jgi:two-component system NarL family sensor kinase
MRSSAGVEGAAANSPLRDAFGVAGTGLSRKLSIQTLERTKGLLDATLNAMPAPVAILDGDGRIVLVNASWRDFLRASGRYVTLDGVGSTYLGAKIFGAISRRHALTLRTALQALLLDTARRFQHSICAAHNGEDRWYQVRAARFEIEGAPRIIITHEDISVIHDAQQTINELSQRLLHLQEEERRRIAVELHDSTAQQLTAIGLHLMALRRKSSTDAATQLTFDEIERSVDEAQKEIRDFSYLLHPPYLDREGLRTTLARFVDGYARRTGLKATAQIANEVDGFIPEAQRALLRIVQEALSNVHRHAAATKVLVRMKMTRKLLLFNISDNGKGLGHAQGGSDGHVRGLGLPGMQARVRQLGGVLKILSDPSGTTISGKLPLSRCQALSPSPGCGSQGSSVA